MSERFTPRDRDQWLSGLAADRSVSDAAVRVGLALILRLHRETGKCDPSISRIAADTGRSERSVARDISELENLGWIRRSSTRGRHKNSYSFRTPATLTKRTVFNPDRPDRVEGLSTLTKQVGQPCQNGLLNPDTVGRHNQVYIEPGIEPGCESLSPNPADSDLFPDSYDRQTTKGWPRKAKSNGSELDSDFAAFWQPYPRKVGKPDARKAFEQAIASGKVTAQELITAAEKYAAATAEAGTEPRFIKFPAGWIRGERWNDPPEEAGQARPHRQSNSGAAPVHAAFMAQFGGDLDDE